MVCHIGGDEETQMMSDATEEIDVTEYANETVRLTTAITGVMNSPTILTGEVSASGKTIAATHPNRESKTYRLDTATIMAGESEFRDSRSYTLYTREDFQNTQSANYGPGAQAGANRISDSEDLPEPTHTPVGEDPEDSEDSDDDPDTDADSEDATEDGTDEYGRVREGERVHLTGETSDGEELDATGTVANVTGTETTVELDDGWTVRKKASVIKARSPEGVPLYFRNPSMTHLTDGEEPTSEDANPGSDAGKTVMTDGGEDADASEGGDYCGAVTEVDGETVTCEKSPDHSDEHAGHVPEDAPGLTWDLHTWSDEERRTDGGEDVTEDGKSVSDHGEPSSVNAWAKADETELLHLLELIREGDEVRVNQRQRSLIATDVSDSEDARDIRLKGNGTWYTLTVERDKYGRPTHAALQYPSGTEYVSHAVVVNRNAMMIRKYDQLLTEELETVAASEHVERMRGHVERSPDRTWNDLSERDRTGEWRVSGDELTAVKWALHAFVSHYRERGRMGGGPTALAYYQNALALWERVRGERDTAYFAGSEFGQVGACLDYAVEDMDIRARIPDAVVDAVDALRRGEDVPNIGADSRVSHPEDATCPTCGGDGEVYDDRSIIACPDCGGEDAAADGGGGIRDVLQGVSGGDGLTVHVDTSADVPSELTGEVSEVETYPDGVNSAVVLTTESGEYVIPATNSPVVASADGYQNVGRCVSVERNSERPDGGEWDPEPATLRDGEQPDVNTHARRNAEQLRVAGVDPGDEDANPGDEPMTDGGEDMDVCHPALYVVHRSRTSPEDVPPAADVADAITEGLEAAGWSTTSDILIDVREGTLMIQDEVPPTPPVEWYGVAAVFSQTEATFTHGYPGPFRLAMDALHDAFPDHEIYVDAVPGSRGGSDV